MQEKITSLDIKKALAKKHKDEFYMTECKNGPTGKGTLIFDALAIYRSWTQPKFIGYEIKISRSDFQRDNKYFGYLPLVHEFNIVCPKDMIDKLEVPTEVGLIYYDNKTNLLKTKKKAIHRKIEIDPQLLLYIIMNRLDTEKFPFTSDKKEYFQEWLENKKSNDSLGVSVKSKLIEEINRLESEIRRFDRIEHYKEEIKEIEDILKKHGIKNLYDKVDIIDKALSVKYPIELDKVQSKLEEALKTIDNIKNSGGSNE